MKKIIALSIVTLLSLQLTSCKKKEKKEQEPTTQKAEIIKETIFSLKNTENIIDFTAYKTTQKVPVKGSFKEIEFINNFEGKTIKEAINDAEFKIPVSSIETNDSGRNFKIKKFFFGVMQNTQFLTGKLTLTDDSKGIAKFTMNGITTDLPFEYSINEKTFSMKSVMNIEKWNAQAAIISLNKICKDLHKGTDGKSKTWSEVSIEVTSVFK